MATTTTQLTSRRRLALAFLATITFAFCTTLVFGANWAFAEDMNLSPAAADSTQNPPEDTTAASNDTNLSAADTTPYPGDTNPNQHAFIGMVPSPLITVPYTRDENNVIYVDINTTVGNGVDIGGRVDYVRISSDFERTSDDAYPAGVYDARGSEANIPLGYDLAEMNRFMVNVYVGETPLAQGAYFSNEIEYQKSQYGVSSPATGSSSGGLQNSTGIEHYNIDPLAFATEGGGNIEGRWCHFAPHVPVLEHETDPYVIHISPTCIYEADLLARNYPNYLMFNEVGTYTYTFQATLCEEYVTPITDGAGVPFVDQFGNTYEYVQFGIYVSNPVVFRIHVAESETANLVINAKNSAGEDVALDGNFHVKIYKDLGTNEFALCSSTDSYATATAGTYKIQIVNRYGNFVKYEETFTIDDTTLSTAFTSGSSITKEVVLTAIPNPVKYTVVFENYDGTILSETEYNAGTLSDAVVIPSVPARAEDDDYTYSRMFSDWEIEQDGKMVTTNVSDVTSNKTYRAHFYATPKDVVSNSVIRVYASGGIFGQPRPSYVKKYELTATLTSEDEKERIKQAYSGRLNLEAANGYFTVGITQHNLDGSTTSLTSGVGDVTLTLPVTLSDGTLANVYQLHELDEGGTVVIEHNGLKVIDGSVNVPLDDKLSTFIVIAADADVPAQTQTKNQQAEPADDPKQPDEPANNATSNSVTGESAAPAKSDNNTAADKPVANVSDAVESAGETTGIAASEILTNDNSDADGLNVLSELITPQLDPAEGSLADMRADVASAFETTLDNALKEGDSRNMLPLLIAAIPFALAVLILLVLMGMIVMHRKNSM